MKAYASFDAYLQDQNPENQAIIRGLRQLVKRSEPKLSETVKWGNGCWVNDQKTPVAYAHCKTDHVQFGFFSGASLEDPNHLLEGKGQYVRHTKVRAATEINGRELAALLRQAAALSRKT